MVWWLRLDGLILVFISLPFVTLGNCANSRSSPTRVGIVCFRTLGELSSLPFDTHFDPFARLRLNRRGGVFGDR